METFDKNEPKDDYPKSPPFWWAWGVILMSERPNARKFSINQRHVNCSKKWLILQLISFEFRNTKFWLADVIFAHSVLRSWEILLFLRHLFVVDQLWNFYNRRIARKYSHNLEWFFFQNCSIKNRRKIWKIVSSNSSERAQKINFVNIKKFFLKVGPQSP